ncbi:MAG TPA: heme-binding protein [Saprospiraceae bacterium]|nr:SOUL heme-binding protein [Saprospirales bacterium]HRQ30779.1 heme-binding protein [Saprospiraceae bacterium]
MKILLIIIAILLIVFLVFQTWLYFSIKKTEVQAYSTVYKESYLEIRYYPAATYATIESPAKSYSELAVSGFRKLAGYIFGGNERNENISMTSPVYMDINDTLSSMSFVLPSKYNETVAPLPNNRSVQLQKKEEVYFAVMRFGGFATDKKITRISEKLKNVLQDKSISYSGNFKYLGYNPPYQIFGRRNEIAVAIEWNRP